MKKKKYPLLQKLKNKYRLVIYNDQTFDEAVSFKLSRLNVFLVVGTSAILLIFATTYIIAFTPLKEYIPGYGDFDTAQEIESLIIRTDSLEKALNAKTRYVNNIKAILSGEDIPDINYKMPDTVISTKEFSYKKSHEDSVLRAEIESQPGYNLVNYNANDNNTSGYVTSSASIKNFFFFTPLNGTVTYNFDPAANHYGVDVVARENEAVKSTLDGIVILSSWTLETGYSIAIQHADNLISVYKHNSVLLKKQGDYVKAGEVIAIIGETGLQTTGIHLHFELWFNGMPVNPRDYIIF
ncbi:MAG: Murein DD-endopeptidase MepM [Bacteroidetes bacterium ADurb.Bin408]|nr:MAG: Murein DD-endopeptidase MepM [Bacteroidetes bacterium ADurb.Bin408]